MDVFPEVKVKTLSNFADHLGVMKDEQRMLKMSSLRIIGITTKRTELNRFG